MENRSRASFSFPCSTKTKRSTRLSGPGGSLMPRSRSFTASDFLVSHSLQMLRWCLVLVMGLVDDGNSSHLGSELAEPLGRAQANAPSPSIPYHRYQPNSYQD